MSIFGLVIPGRPVDTNFQQVDTNKFLLTIPNADTINHVVVFLTGVAPLLGQTAGCIYFSLPDPNAAPTWHYLGHLRNDKPSAIYKLTNLTHNQSNETKQPINGGPLNNEFGFNYVQAPVIHVAQIGISIEPLSQVNQMVPEVETAASKASLFNEFITKTVSNLYNYCSSFSRSTQELLAAYNDPIQQANIRQSSNDQYVPLNTLKAWYENYTRRLSHDENFWKSLS